MTSVNAAVGSAPGQVNITAGGTQTTVASTTATATATAQATTQTADARVDAPKPSEPPPAGRAELPTLQATFGPPDGPAFGQATLDKAFSAMDSLEKEMAGIDPTSPEGSKKMMEIERKLQRVDQLITMITNMRRMVHEMNMHAIRSIVS